MINDSDLVRLRDRRIAALLSGGVDSSVAVAELVKAGFRPDLWYIQIAPDEDEELTCTIEEDLEMARSVAAKYRLPLQVVDLHADYWKRVVNYTMERVRAGLTPNPDVMCNRLIKFGVFDERVGHDYDIIATGHYATTEQDADGRTWLCTSPDPVKDQTDFLAQLMPWQLQKACFPIGHLPKAEVRAIAEAEHLTAAHRKDSQGICFLGKIDYNDYIRRYLGERPGQVIDQATGRVLGMHRGVWFHTIGQRKGLGFSGGPWYVVRKDLERDILWVANGYDAAEQYSDHFATEPFHWLTINPFASEGQTLDVALKIRHTPEFTDARATLLPDGSLDIVCSRPLQGVAPGQFAVLYDSARHRCYGSAEIQLRQGPLS